MRLHRRQFVLGPEPVRVGADWIVRQHGSLVLSHCPELSVQTVTDAAGHAWLLSGIVTESRAELPSPCGALMELEGRPPETCYGSWAGRWILVGESELHMDAAGLLGCFYRRLPSRNGEPSGWASSSPVLLRQLPGAPPIDSGRLELKHNEGLDWYPPPRSRHSTIQRLLPSQVLDVALGSVRPRRLLPPVSLSLVYDEILVAIRDRIAMAMERVARTTDDLWLALTGGHDSRLLLAVARWRGITFKTFTQEYKGMPLADRLLPPKLAASAGYPHLFVRPGRPSEEAVRRYLAHNDFHTARDLDCRFYSRGQWRFAPKSSVVLRSGGVEIGLDRNAFLYLFDRTVADAGTLLERLGEARESFARAGIEEWLEWITGTGRESGDWRHRLYLEQRLAGWLSSIEQSLDLVDAGRFYPANSSETYGLMVSIPDGLRARSRYQRDLIERLAPDLAQLPFNPQDDDFGRLRELGYRLRDDPLLSLKGPARKLRRLVRALHKE